MRSMQIIAASLPALSLPRHTALPHLALPLQTQQLVAVIRPASRIMLQADAKWFSVQTGVFAYG